MVAMVVVVVVAAVLLLVSGFLGPFLLDNMKWISYVCAWTWKRLKLIAVQHSIQIHRKKKRNPSKWMEKNWHCISFQSGWMDGFALFLAHKQKWKETTNISSHAFWERVTIYSWVFLLPALPLLPRLLDQCNIFMYTCLFGRTTFYIFHIKMSHVTWQLLGRDIQCVFGILWFRFPLRFPMVATRQQTQQQHIHTR